MLFITLILLYIIGALATKKHLSAKDDEDFVNHVNRHPDSSRTAYIINSVKHGGAYKFVHDITSTFPTIHFVSISKEHQLNKLQISPDSVVFINHIVHSDISVIDIINLKKSTNGLFILVIHDFFYLALQNPFYHINYPLAENETHGSYVFRKEIDPVVCEMIQMMDIVIHQNSFSLNEFEKYCPSRKNSMVIPPADYAVKRVGVIHRPIVNKEINLGMITSFSEYKGREMILILRHLYPTYKQHQINWKISGVNIPQYADSMTSFVNLITRQGIQGLVYLSKYGETFSFAMTKYLNSQLPILYNNFGSFKERLRGEDVADVRKANSGLFSIFEQEEEYLNFIKEFDYLVTPPKKNKNAKTKPQLNLLQDDVAKHEGHEDHAEGTTENEEDQNDTNSLPSQLQDHTNCTHSACLKFEAFLDHLIDHCSPVTLKPGTFGDAFTPYQQKLESLDLPNKIRVNPAYQKLFLPHLAGEKKHLFIITSKINVSHVPFSYINQRSIYSTHDRFKQTLQTIKTIRDHLPNNSYIVMIDNSMLPKHYLVPLRRRVDHLIADVHDKVLNYYTDQYAYKGFAEVAQLINVYNRYLKYLDVSSFENVFKMTGRYTLTESFNISYYSSSKGMMFKRDEKLTEMKYYYTCFYKIEPSYVHEYFELLKRLFVSKEEYIGKKMLNLEEQIPWMLEYNFTEVRGLLGVRQNIAVWNETSEI
eukprot:gene8688-9402_t